jgi:hypothetical protein
MNRYLPNHVQFDSENSSRSLTAQQLRMEGTHGLRAEGAQIRSELWRAENATESSAALIRRPPVCQWRQGEIGNGYLVQA